MPPFGFEYEFGLSLPRPAGVIAFTDFLRQALGTAVVADRQAGQRANSIGNLIKLVGSLGQDARHLVYGQAASSCFHYQAARREPQIVLGATIRLAAVREMQLRAAKRQYGCKFRPCLVHIDQARKKPSRIRSGWFRVATM